jgi:hypothetical protein
VYSSLAGFPFSPAISEAFCVSCIHDIWLKPGSSLIRGRDRGLCMAITGDLDAGFAFGFEPDEGEEDADVGFEACPALAFCFSGVLAPGNLLVRDATMDFMLMTLL